MMIETNDKGTKKGNGNGTKKVFICNWDVVVDCFGAGCQVVFEDSIFVKKEKQKAESDDGVP